MKNNQLYLSNIQECIHNVEVAGVQIANGATDSDDDGLLDAPGADANGKNGTRDYIAGIAYDPDNRTT